MKLLLTITGLALAASQQCDCQPQYMGSTCASCSDPVLTEFEPDTCQPVSLAKVRNEWYPSDGEGAKPDKYSEPAVTEYLFKAGSLGAMTKTQVDCYGQGTFNVKTTACICNSDALAGGGKYCSECADSKFINWPQCNVEACDDLTCKDSLGQVRGTCNADFVKQATSKACGPNPYNPNTQMCCPNEKDEDGKSLGGLDADGYPAWVVLTKVQNDGTATGATCCGNLPGGCDYGETCIREQGVDPNDETKEVTNYWCLRDGLDRCDTVDEKQLVGEDKDTPAVTGVTGCMPYESCCYGTCCSYTQTCQKIANGNAARLGFLLPKLSEDADDEYVPEANQHQCFNNLNLSAPSAIRIGVLPFVLLVGILSSTAMVLSGAGMGAMTVSGPALGNILFAFFLIFSSDWQSSMQMSLSSLLAIGSQSAKFDNKHLFSLIFQLIFFASFLGNLGLGSIFVSGKSYFGSLNGSGAAAWSESSVCANYYGYFDQNSNMPWDSNQRYWGYCSKGWLTFITLSQAMMVMFSFLSLVGTGLLMSNKTV